MPAPSPEVVEVPNTNCPLGECGIQSLTRAIPLQDVSIKNAVEVFISTVEFVREILSSPLLLQASVPILPILLTDENEGVNTVNWELYHKYVIVLWRGTM